jgi:hypothetical protein
VVGGGGLTPRLAPTWTVWLFAFFLAVIGGLILRGLYTANEGVVSGSHPASTNAWKTEEDRVGQIMAVDQADGVRCFVYYGHQGQSISCVKVR